MRVMHVAQSTAGGIASYIEEIAEYQAKLYGADNVVFVVPSGAAHLPNLKNGQLRFFGAASRRPRDLGRFAAAIRAELARFQPDIVHLHSSFAGAIVRPMLAAQRRRPKVIYCPHGWAFGMEISTGRQRAYAAVERGLAKVTDLIHLNSQAEFNSAARFGLPREKMRVIANGIGPAPLPPETARDGPIRVAFVGRHDRQKGLDILLDVVRRTALPNLHFDVVGDGILSPGVGPEGAGNLNVTFHGWMSRTDTLRLVESVDAVVMPSRWDAAPIVATEAMRAGVAVIGSNRGGIPEIVADGVGGYIFDLEDRGSLGRVLQSLDRPKLRRLGKSARQRWETHYQADRMNQLTSLAYAEVLNGPDSQSLPNASADVRAGHAQPWA